MLLRSSRRRQNNYLVSRKNVSFIKNRVTVWNRSLVIEKLGEHVAQGSKIGLGYIYCDYRDQKEQTTENILGAILKQLFGLLSEIPEAVLKLYAERVSQGKPLSLTDAVNLLGIAC